MCRRASREVLEDTEEIVRHRRGELHPAAVPGVGERQTRGVQERSFESLHGANVSWYPPVDAAVERIAHDGVADTAQVNTNLVRAACVNRQLAEREARHVMGARDPRHGMASMFRASRHLLAIRRVASDRRIDAASCLYDAPHEGDVSFSTSRS